jgi:hypothetical protein
MRGERKLYAGERPTVTAPERVLVLVGVMAVMAFEIWFFFFSGSPIDQRSGRGALPTYTVGTGKASRCFDGPGSAKDRVAGTAVCFKAGVEPIER